MPRKVVFRKKQNKSTKQSKPPKSVEREVTIIGKALRGLGALGGGLAGGMLGQPAFGSAAGHGLGAALSKWMGYGDYTVSKNSITQRSSATIPAMHSNNQTVVVRHREFLTSIQGSNAFTVQQAFILNPGVNSTFPWLSGIADRFQEYKVLGMVYHYVPTSGTFNGSTAALGSVMFQTSYRATDVAPLSKAEMLNEYWASETVPYETLAHPIECDPKENPFAVHYVRNSNATGVIEPLMYDLAKTFVATSGMTNTDVVGDIWVTYEIELKKPLVASPVVAIPTYLSITFDNFTFADLFSNPYTVFTGDASTFSFSGNNITFPNAVQKYAVTLRLTAALITQTGSPSWGWPNPVVISGPGIVTNIDTVTSNIGDVMFNALLLSSANAIFYQFGVSTTGSCVVSVPSYSATIADPSALVVSITPF
jgi:outer membrane lipoprotein SlyB